MDKEALMGSANKYSEKMSRETAVRAISATDKELDVLAKIAERLMTVVDSFGGRLTPVMCDNYPTPGKPEEERPTLSSVATRVRNSREIVEGAIDHLQSMLDRLEI